LAVAQQNGRRVMVVTGNSQDVQGSLLSGPL
jgi:hypothetical protein